MISSVLGRAGDPTHTKKNEKKFSFHSPKFRTLEQVKQKYCTFQMQYFFKRITKGGVGDLDRGEVRQVWEY